MRAGADDAVRDDPMQSGARRLTSGRLSLPLQFGWVLALGLCPSQSPAQETTADYAASGPPSAPMTIPLPDPVFWDPVNAKGDYAVVEQEGGLFLLHPTTGRIVARLQSPRSAGAQPLGLNPTRSETPSSRPLTSPAGWPFRPGGEVSTTPVVDDLDHDGVPEVIFVTRDGWVWVLGPDALPLAGWPVALGVDCHAGAALADLDLDGLPEILVGDAAGRVHVFRRDGTYLKGWPAKIPGDRELPGIYGALAAADLDRDGLIEIVATQAVGRVCVWKADGQVAPGWPVATAPAEDPSNVGAIFSRPALGDLDGDGRLEVVAGANNYRVHVWTAEGRTPRGWPRLLDNRARAGYADPVLADLNNDGRPEILIATDQGFSGPPRIYALDALGRDVKGWPVNLPERCNAGVAVGDLDQDGDLDVVAATVGQDCSILAWDAQGKPRRGFPIGLSEMSVNACPILADADGDDAVDIIVAALRTQFDPGAFVFALQNDGDNIHPFPIGLEGCEVICGGPCVADLDGDGLLELLLATEVQGRVYAWDLSGSAEGKYAPWPRPGLDSANTGLYHALVLRKRPPAPRVEAPTTEKPPPQGSFSPLQSVSFALYENEHVRICITDVQRKPVRTLIDTFLPTGAYTISWDGTDDNGSSSAAGVYFYELRTRDRTVSGQLLLLR